MWGAFPLFFPLLEPARPAEILAHRIVWSLLAIAAPLAIGRPFPALRALMRDRRRVALLGAAALLIALNWGVFIYAVNSDHVIEGSLGYFINPLVSVAFGVFVFRERLRRGGDVGLSLAACAGGGVGLDYGRAPRVAPTRGRGFGAHRLR